MMPSDIVSVSAADCLEIWPRVMENVVAIQKILEMNFSAGTLRRLSQKVFSCEMKDQDQDQDRDNIEDLAKILNGVTIRAQGLASLAETIVSDRDYLTAAVEEFISGEKDRLRAIVRGCIMKIAEYPDAKVFSTLETMTASGVDGVNEVFGVVYILIVLEKLLRKAEEKKAEEEAEYD
jgi:hypothetical protein